MRLATPLVLLALLAAFAGCGSSEDGETSFESATFDGTELIQEKWEHASDCDRPSGASRWGCTIGSYRCQAVVVGRGWSVSCARPGDSVAFTVRP
jgi:hypothetical protein